MTNTSSKSNLSITTIIIVIASTIITTIFINQLLNFSRENGSATNTPNLAKSTSCKTNSKAGSGGGIEGILRSYKVVNGDSLLSIARKELGDSSRYQEIAVMNASKFPQFFSSPGVVSKNTFLEQGWILLLPPDWIKSSSGQLDIVSGMIFDADQEGMKITNTTDKSGWLATISLDANTLNSGKSDFKIGDCITAVRDIRMNKILKIDLQ